MTQKSTSRFPRKQKPRFQGKGACVNTVSTLCLRGEYVVFTVCLPVVFTHTLPNRPLPKWTIAGMAKKECHLTGLPVDF